MGFPWKKLKLREFVTSDNATLFYYKRYAKSKQSLGTMLIVPGWLEGPDNWSPFIITNEYVKQHYDIYILTMRGYNNIEDDFNNTISRYAQDVVEFIKSKNLKKVTAIGQTLGCAVIWNAISLYEEKYFDSYVFIDQGLRALSSPNGSNVFDSSSYGSIITSDELFNFYEEGVSGENNTSTKINEFQLKKFTPSFIADYPNIYIKYLAGSLGYNYKVAYEVYFNYICNNYDEMLKNGINKPTLLIGGGDTSVFPFSCIQFEEQYFKIPTVKIFASGSGSYIEKYDEFNIIINDFLKKKNNNLRNFKITTSNKIENAIKNEVKKIGAKAVNSIFGLLT